MPEPAADPAKVTKTRRRGDLLRRPRRGGLPLPAGGDVRARPRGSRSAFRRPGRRRDSASRSSRATAPTATRRRSPARLGIAAPPLRLDSQAKYAVVARGEADIYLRMPTRADYREKIWDHAAGALIVEEAGGTVTDVDGRPLDFTRGPRLEANRGVVVSNGRWHPRAIAAIAGLGLASG